LNGTRYQILYNIIKHCFRYEVEIRRRNDEIERKQSEVDRLNKKFDLLMSNMKDENMGPLEATIHNLTNEIAKKAKECSDLQYYW
jgi:hypothetical protein